MWNHVWNFWKLWSTLEFKESFIQYKKKKTNRKQTAVGHFDNFYNPVLHQTSDQSALFPSVWVCAWVVVSLSFLLSLFAFPFSFPFSVFLFYLISFFSFSFLFILLHSGHPAQLRGFVALVLFVLLLLRGCHGFLSRCFMFLTSNNFYVGIFKKPWK